MQILGEANLSATLWRLVEEVVCAVLRLLNLLQLPAQPAPTIISCQEVQYCACHDVANLHFGINLSGHNSISADSGLLMPLALHSGTDK